ncbi:DUF6306 domain-containing protein [Sphingobium sp. Cam5-1]|uniref:DUF6306 domain-containing protein n=1 Tax=Sphingobium sp. Cam5-1 TaxID=2789327 RepID=UPI0018AD1271|nr:DUF6306 domain-containing protein [Sphingobium sp. Cam5-1]QPI75482.1 hypothetical protein IZV00_18650 [Sphingobium sp. Cam5-1]
MMNEPSSPVCYGAGADDQYMGFASRDEIVAALNELLEAERAGARIALASGRGSENVRFSELMRIIRADEAYWCAMLSRQIRGLGAVPSRRTGAFYGRAMDIVDPHERTLFLNRGQSWVVRKLQALMPRVRDEVLHMDLQRMAERHGTNIKLAEAFLQDAG